MALGLAPATANAILNALCRNTAWTQPAQVWVKLHIGDPGAAGTSNPPATLTTRVQVTFGTAASGGSLSNTVSLSWTSAPTAEDYSHFSAWDASTAGNFLFSGLITANAVSVGDNFTIGVGGLVVSLTVAA